MMTIVEVKGGLDGIRLCFVGDGNNVARSLAVASALLGVDFVLACPKGYEFPREFVDQFSAHFPAVPLRWTHDPREAADGSDVVYTDVWASMGQESEADHRREIFAPYHDRIRQDLDRRREAARPTLLVTLHSFTPAMAGFDRPWHCGVLYHRDARLAHALRDALQAEGDLVVGDNQPYAVSDTSDYAVPVHGEARGLPHVELEIRQDLIADDAGQRQWAQRLSRLLRSLEPRFAEAES